MIAQHNRRRLIAGGAGMGGIMVVLLLALSCSQGEDFKYMRIERDESPMSAKGKTDLGVIFTGSTKGEFEPCGCGGVFEGGFARRSTVIQTIRRANPEVLLLDTGDTTGAGSAAQTEFIDQAYHLLRYDAIAIGELDLRVGMEPFNKYARQYKLPFVCSNLKFKKPTPIRETIAVNRGGKRLAIISVVSDRWLAILPMSVRDEFTYETPRATLRRLIPALQKEYDGIILLSHLGPNVRETINPDLQGVDLWIDNGGHQWSSGYRPSTQPVGTDSQSIKKSHFLLDRPQPLFISWQNDRKVGVAAIKWVGRRMEIPTMDMIPLVRGMVEDKTFLDIYDTYKYVSRQEMVRRLMSPSGTTTRPAAFGFVDSEQCGTCHQEIFEFWKTTKHAHAFATLKKGSRDADLNCWACHTTGFREDGGFMDVAATPKLVDVGCQDCHHKDLKTHPKAADAEVRPVGAVPSPNTKYRTIGDNMVQDWHCRRCHVPHRSPAYEYKSYLKRISCSQALKKTNSAPETQKARP